MTDAYRESLEFLYGRLNFERTSMPRTSAEMRLGRMRRLLQRLDDPQDGLRIVHITGTKGKGSTASMLAAALTASGRKTGLFCSPHLHRLEERFRIDGEEVASEELVNLVDAIRPVVESFDAREPAFGGRGLTFFEVTTALGLLHFARQSTDTVVLEVGMGGRLDSTNAVRPLLSIITTVSFDHTRQLGRTLEAIAYEKAGIIKHRTPVLSGVTQGGPRSVIRDVAGKRKSPLRELGRDYGFSYLPPAQPVVKPETGWVEVRTWRSCWDRLHLPLAGRHQAHNAALALAALDVLGESGFKVTSASVARGFASLRIPARVEVLDESPWIVVDGAHNRASAEALAEALRSCFPACPRTLVFGTTREKDLRGQLGALLPLFDRCVATRYVENPRSISPEEVASEVHALSGREAILALTPAMALNLGRQITPPQGLICITGSMFLAAETRALLLELKSTPVPTSAATP